MTYCTDKSCTCDLKGLSTVLVTDLRREDGPYGESEDWWGGIFATTNGLGPDEAALRGIEAFMEDELDISEFMPRREDELDIAEGPLVEVTVVRPGDTLDYVLAPTATHEHYIVEAWLGEEVYHTHVYGDDLPNGVIGAIITITAHITALCGEGAISLLEWRCLQPVPQVLSTGD